MNLMEFLRHLKKHSLKTHRPVNAKENRNDSFVFLDSIDSIERVKLGQQGLTLFMKVKVLNKSNRAQGWQVIENISIKENQVDVFQFDWTD